MAEVIGRTPEVAVRRVSEYDWTCELHVTAGSQARLLVSLFVGGAVEGWAEDLVAAGASTVVGSTLGVDAITVDDAAILFESGTDLIMLAGIDHDGFALDQRAHALLAQRVLARLTGDP